MLKTALTAEEHKDDSNLNEQQGLSINSESNYYSSIGNPDEDSLEEIKTDSSQESFWARSAKHSDSTVHFARTVVLTSVNIGFLSRCLSNYYNPSTAIIAHCLSTLISEAHYNVNLDKQEEQEKGIPPSMIILRQLAGIPGGIAAYYVANALSGNNMVGALAGTAVTYTSSFMLNKFSSIFVPCKKTNNEKIVPQKSPNDPFLLHSEENPENNNVYHTL